MLKSDRITLRAQRAYKACGFSGGAYDDLVLMGIMRQEWEAKNNYV